MKRWKFTFARTYTITEGFDRVIEAPSYEEARAAAANLAREFNDDCPDDCSEDESGYTETGDFFAENAANGDKPIVVVLDPDYRVQEDGQIIPALD